MGEDEIFVFVISGVLSAVGLGATSTAGLHRLHFRANPGIGAVKLGVWLAMLWIAFVLWRYADPSVRGVYVWFYLVMGLALVKCCGQAGGALLGVRFRVDVCERKNLPGALFLAAFVLATGLIFGGSLWGEADPDGEGEGGWWIPLTFFLAGWSGLVGMMGLFLWREPGSIRLRLLQNRSLADAKAGATYLLGVGLIMTETVAGDFHGWKHGLLSFGVVGVMLLGHEISMKVAGAVVREGGPSSAPRWFESGFYLLCGLGSWGASRFFEGMLNPGV